MLKLVSGFAVFLTFGTVAPFAAKIAEDFAPILSILN